MFILRPILNNMKQNGYVDIKHEQWIFHKDTMPNVDLDSEANTFDEKYNKLINGFVDFCNAPDEINYNTADKIITDFIDDNNFDTKVYTGRELYMMRVILIGIFIRIYSTTERTK